MVHQYMPKTFHDPHKNPPAPPSTYLIYGPLISLSNIAKISHFTPIFKKIA